MTTKAEFLSMTLTLTLCGAAFAENPAVEIIKAADGTTFRRKGNSGFYQVYDKNGKARSQIVDKIFVDFYTAPEINPTQKSLDKLFDSIDKIIVCAYEVPDEGRPKEIIRFTASSPAELSEIRKLMKISEDPKTFNHCMCIGMPAIKFMKAKQEIAYMTCQHGNAIRWDKWKWDAELLDGKALAKYFAKHGSPEPLAEMEEAEREAKEFDDEFSAWKKWVPSFLPTEKLLKDSGWNTDGTYLFGMQESRRKLSGMVANKKLKPYRDIFDKNFNNGVEAVSSLLIWNGAPRPSFHIYQDIPEAILDTYHLSDIFSAVRGGTKNIKLLDGAVWYFATHSEEVCKLVPKDIQKILLERASKMKQNPEQKKNLESLKEKFGIIKPKY